MRECVLNLMDCNYSNYIFIWLKSGTHEVDKYLQVTMSYAVCYVGTYYGLANRRLCEILMSLLRHIVQCRHYYTYKLLFITMYEYNDTIRRCLQKKRRRGDRWTHFFYIIGIAKSTEWPILQWTSYYRHVYTATFNRSIICWVWNNVTDELLEWRHDRRWSVG